MDSLSINGARAIQKFRSQIKKKKQKLNLTRYKETNTKWVIDLNVKHKMISCLGAK